LRSQQAAIEAELRAKTPLRELADSYGLEVGDLRVHSKNHQRPALVTARCPTRGVLPASRRNTALAACQSVTEAFRLERGVNHTLRGAPWF
jgi:hypothetical protein